ncbi:MAG: DUF1990 family protein [Myxococcaceae bacterium]|nr:DUF1990 family protein [Myxococcaceae bacterium]
MSRWRWRGTFPPAEVERALKEARGLPPNFDAVSFEVMRPETGWNHVLSRAVVSRERNGAFEWARHLMRRLAFSDPRIVTVHLPHDGELCEGDALVLELRTFGPRFLCPVRIAHVEERMNGDERRAGLALETLRGHVERGREWFHVLEDRQTGVVRFSIEARWRAGDFPGLWAWAGFELMGRRYQRAWHRLAHQRMRRFIASKLEEEPMLQHPEPISFYARRSSGALRAAVEQEFERVRRDRLLRIAALGALCGARTLTPVAGIARHYARTGRLEGVHSLGGHKAARVLTVASAGEWVVDKLPMTPDRTGAVPLFGRALAGATVGSMLGRAGSRTRRKTPLVLGALAAIAGTFLTASLRRALTKIVGPTPAALTEDLLTLTATALLARTL